MSDAAKVHVIPRGLLGAVGTLWAGTPSAVSPFFGAQPAPVTDADRKVLAAAGICGGDGQLDPALRPALDVVGAANAFTRVYVSGEGGLLEYMVYFAPSGDSASLANDDGAMQVDRPAAVPSFLAAISQRIGTSLYRNAALEATLPPDEAVVLAGLLDLQRRRLLRDTADGAGSVAVDASVADVAAACAGPTGDRQWLASVMLELLSAEGIGSDDRCATALKGLVERKIIVMAGSAFRLGDEALYLARRMLVLDSALTLTVGHLGQAGGVSISGFTCLQAGVHDLLYIDAGADGVDVRCISAAGVLEYCMTFFTDADVLKGIGAEARPLPATETVPAPVAVAQAAAPARAGAAPPPAFCVRCGAKLAPGAAFCVKCGAKVG